MPRVLLVDDEPNIRWTLSEFLKKQGFDPITAPDYESAVGILQTEEIDVAVVDILLPGKSGVDLLREISRRQQYTPVLMMTGEPDIERIPEIMRAGACDYMAKPVVKDALIEAVSRALDKKRAVDEKTRIESEISRRARELELLVEERTRDLAAIEGANREAVRSLQEKLETSERVALLGRAAAQIAHEVKNPLAGLRLYAFHLKSKLAGLERQPEVELVDKIINTLDHLSHIVERTLDFARPIKISPALFDVNRILIESLHVLEPHLAANEITIDKSMALTKLACSGDQALVRSAMVNVIINAIESMPTGGRLTVKTNACPGSISIEVADTGCGITEANLERVFEPFHTSKARGLGLGLPYSKKIIEEHRGTIEISSQPGRGTIVIIKLPAREVKLPAGEIKSSAAE